MAASIILLQVILLLSSFGFIQPSDLLQCFNDYDTELKCSLTLAKGNNCTDHNLAATLNLIPENRFHTCHFDEILPGKCECAMHVLGFVLHEIFTINVQKGGKIWHTENISTEQSIKPRRPIIMSVIQKINGDFLINLNTTYTKEPFSKSLMVELMYGTRGSDDNVTKLLESQPPYEIVGRNLQPNSEYILRARVKSDYPPSTTFSDYSEPHVFRTPPSLQSILKIIIPILCLMLIICISSIYFWFDRILKPWWDKVPTPKLSTNFVKRVPWLLSFQTEFSSVHLDPSANHVGKKTCVEVQGEDNRHIFSPEKGVDLAPLIYSTTVYGKVGESSSENVLSGLDKKHQSTNTEKEQSNDLSSGISNRSYLQSSSSSSSFFKHPVASIYPSEDFVQLSNSLNPTIHTDFEYSMWNGCTDSGNSKLIHITPSDDETDALDAFSDSEDNHDAFSSCNKESFSIKKPQDVPFPVHDSIIMPMDEEYQMV